MLHCGHGIEEGMSTNRRNSDCTSYIYSKILYLGNNISGRGQILIYNRLSQMRLIRL